ncbi:protein FAM216A [Danio rerio]|uniref:Protein FAM216A n=1 Tax=Danio rerio TaxID=7955 RepID=A0AB13A7Q7_DANRE|nr:protein FAM216A [Danio rerio]|eukprot:XP_017208335.1 protein FAM216A [Danio rerio]
MQKHVKFTENISDKNRLYHKRSSLPSRLSGLNVQDGKGNPVFGHKTQRPATAHVPEQDQTTKTIHIQKTMTAAPFLQHPILTPGQKRFLYRMEEAYSTEHMRQLICQHYMNVLHRCIKTVPEVNTNLQVKVQTSTCVPEIEHMENLESTSTIKTKGIGKKSKVKKTILPKIINHQRRSSEFVKSKTVQSNKRRATIPNHTTLRGSRTLDADFEWKATEMDSYLACHMSGLSFNELSDEDEDFLL